MDLTTHHKTLEHPEHSIVYNAAMTILISVIGYGLNFVLNLLFARYLEPDVYGDLSIIIRVISLCALFGLFGINTSVIRFYPAYIGAEKKSFAYGLLRWNIKIVTIVSLTLTIIGALIASAAFVSDRLGIMALNQFHPVIFAFWLIPLYVFTILYGKSLQGAKQFGTSLLTMNIGLTGLEIILFFIFIFFFKTISIYSVLLILGLAHMLVIVVQFIIFRAKALNTVSDSKPAYERKKWFRFSLKMLFNNVLIYAGGALSLIMLEILGQHEDEVGMFAAILTIKSIIYVISGAIQTVVNPTISANMNNKKVLQKLINKAKLIQTIILTVVLIIALIFARDLLTLFRPSYTVVLPSLIVCFVGSYLCLFLSMSGSLLLYAGYEGQELISNIIFLVGAIVFSVVLIPHFQIMGAAIAISLSSLCSYIYDIVLCRMKLGIKVLFIV